MTEHTTETPALPEVTDDLLAQLEFRYADPRVCRVCGAPLQLADTRGMKMTCTSDAASPFTNRHEPAGGTWKTALDHWDQSTMYNPPVGDLRVIALVAEVRRIRVTAAGLAEDWEATAAKLDARAEHNQTAGGTVMLARAQAHEDLARELRDAFGCPEPAKDSNDD